jgi:hypothetical protein
MTFIYRVWVAFNYSRRGVYILEQNNKEFTSGDAFFAIWGLPGQ